MGTQDNAKVDDQNRTESEKEDGTKANEDVLATATKKQHDI